MDGGIMPSNTTYDPENQAQFSKFKLKVANKGISTSCVASQTTNLDYTLTDDVLLVGMMIGCKNQVEDDTMHLEVHHPSLGLIDRFTEDWNVFENQQLQIDTESIFPAKLVTGLIIRIVYNSTGQNDVKLKVNLKLHKILT